MKTRTAAGVTTGKRVAVWCLFAVSGLITVLGVTGFVCGFLHQTEFTVLQSSLPGALFGAVIAFLGVRYTLSVRKLQAKLYAAPSKFSWSNFKK